MDVLGAPTAYAALALMPPDLPLSTGRELLLRRLVRVTRAERAQLRYPGQEVIAWPGGVGPEPAAGAAHVELRGGEVLTLVGGRRGRRELAATADCLTALHRQEEMNTRLRRQVDHTAQLAGEVLDSSRRLARIRDLERRRLSAQIAGFSSGRLSPIQRSVERMLNQEEGSAGEPARMRADLERLSADFRAMVRGIHPRTMHRVGLHRALRETTASFQQLVRIDGYLPPRIEPMLYASLYYLATTCIEAEADSFSELKVTMGLVSAGAHVTVRLRTPEPEGLVRARLSVETDRIGMVGGRVDVSGSDGWITVVVWVPDRLEPVPDASLIAPGSLFTQVRSLALRLVSVYGDGPGSAPARHLLGRLDEPVQVQVVGPPDAPEVRRAVELTRSRQDLLLITQRPGRPERGRHPDVVLRSDHGLLALELPGTGTLLRTRPEDLSRTLTTEVVGRADLLRARTALAAMRRMVHTAPESLAGEIDDLSDRTARELRGE